MAYRVLELNLISANDLKKVTILSRMRVYAVASISGGDPRMPTYSTQADRYGGCNPVWNSVLHFPIAATADTRGLALHVLLRTEHVFGSRDVGEVFLPIDDLLAGADKASDARPATYQVRRPRSGRPHGVLYFCYKFIEVPAAGATANKEGQNVIYVQGSEKPTAMDKVGNAQPVIYPHPQLAAPPYQPTPYARYPPQSYPYVAPQPYGYNAAPQVPATYGYAARPPAKQQGGGMGMGLGLGLVSGAVSGMMIGEMIGDAEADAAYDAGFNDALSL